MLAADVGGAAGVVGGTGAAGSPIGGAGGRGSGVRRAIRSPRRGSRRGGSTISAGGVGVVSVGSAGGGVG
jgi:hypothetical protein